MAQASWEAFQKNRTHNYVTRTPEEFDAGKAMGKESHNLFDVTRDNIFGGDGMSSADYMLSFAGAFLFALFAGKYINDFLRSQSSITYIATIATCLLLAKGSYIFACFFLVSSLVIFIIFMMSMVSSTGKNVWYALDTRYRHRTGFEEIIMSYMAQESISPPTDKFQDRQAFAVYIANIMTSDKYYKDFDHNDSISYLIHVLAEEAESGNHYAEGFLRKIITSTEKA
jgi:hypothetical protein